MRALVESALRLRVLVVAVAVVLMVWGIAAFRDAPQDVFPEFAPPRVEIQTEARGLSTAEVEQLVTTPLEQALAGLPWVVDVRSKSVLGLSSVVLDLERQADPLVARQLVAERVGVVASQLPASVAPPTLLPPLSSTSRLLKIGVRSDTLGIADLTDAAMLTVRPRLMAIPGVANVAVWGARSRQLQVRVDPDRLALAGTTVPAVRAAAGASVWTGSGGFVDTPNQRMAVFHTSPVADAADLARAPLVAPDGRVLRLGDVADVVESHAVPIGDAVIDGGEGLLLVVEKQPWGNTLQVTHAVEAELARIAPTLPGVELDPSIFRPASFVEKALENLGHAMTSGVILVVLVLVLFEPDPRSALISATAIPLSIALAVLVLTALGTTFDTMVLAGLVIAVGEVVDDAIIDVENISRRLRAREQRTAFDVVLEASMEVRSAVVYASLIVVLVFLPVFFLDGVSGAFFRPLATAYIVAITASLLVALTVTPALCLAWLPGQRERGPRRTTLWTLRAYRAVLPTALAHPRLVGVGVGVALLASLASVPLLGESFLPDFQERDFLMHWVEQPGTSLTAMRRITERVGEELVQVPGVRSFGAHIGRAEAADEVVGPNFTELWVGLEDGADHADALARIHAVVDGYPGLHRDVQTYLKERIKEVLSGTSATLAVRIHGPDLEGLKEAAQTVHRALTTVPGIADPRIEVQALVPQVQVALRPEASELYGLSTRDIRDAVTPLLAGTVEGSVRDGRRSVDVVVIGEDALRADPTALAALWVDAPTGGRVRLGDVADLWIGPSPNVIHHDGGSRRIDVLADVGDSDLGTVARGIEVALAGVTLPPGYSAEVLGEQKERAAATRSLTWLSLGALLAVFLVLHADFGDLRLAGLVFATLPFALIGGVVAVWSTGGTLSLGSVVGFVTVLGIATRNGILLVSHLRHLAIEAPELSARERVSRACEERVVPILMTASSAGLALLPIAWAGPVAGHEIEHPMAVVILGGLVTSTLLNLLCLPSLYLAAGGGSDRATMVA
ncbi:MAG: efflux RND transporter permease subunit [Alphaproteobacteria bacterium]|nr:efflux RND transporter permease subunit [Alphaproteobacteria bacterium]